MPLTPWNTKKIVQYNQEQQQALLFDEQTLAAFSQDFGKLKTTEPAAVYLPENTRAIQQLLSFANQHQLPITIRGNGLSQNGQSLARPGGVTLSMQNFNKVLQLEEDHVWVEANSSWDSVLATTLKKHKAPLVLPYNCNLSVAGVLSAGGVGASSFKYGPIAANVIALEVIDGKGQLQKVDSNSELFHACLGGQGRFGIITKVAIALRPIADRVKTFCLIYDNYQQWLMDIKIVQNQVDYMELFCSPSIQGMKLGEQGPKPLVQWLYGMHLTIEYEDKIPVLPKNLHYWKLIHSQELKIDAFLMRHNPRFESMKQTGLWDLIHPWYECFVPTSLLNTHLAFILEQLPLHYASLVHVVPIAKKEAGFVQFPDAEDVSAFMILNPGIGEPLKASCLQAIQFLDEFFLSRGGKRYLSGYLGENLNSGYWKNHFGSQYENWISLKQRYDPIGVFCSTLHHSEIE